MGLECSSQNFIWKKKSFIAFVKYVVQSENMRNSVDVLMIIVFEPKSTFRSILDQRLSQIFTPLKALFMIKKCFQCFQILFSFF